MIDIQKQEKNGFPFSFDGSNQKGENPKRYQRNEENQNEEDNQISVYCIDQFYHVGLYVQVSLIQIIKDNIEIIIGETIHIQILD